VDIYNTLLSYGVAQIAVCDPFASPKEAYSMYGIEIANTIPSSFEEYDVVFLAVAHAPFLELNDYHRFYTPQRQNL
jgi:UDP-glucose/GDP-mannose dehydrogenase family, UDP binding domain.